MEHAFDLLPVSTKLVNPTLTAYVDKNSPILHRILKLYVPPPAFIADVTWGKGSFWSDIPVDVNLVDEKVKLLHPGQFFKPPEGWLLLASDVNPEISGVDCRSLPYMDGCIDAVVLDPPYAGTGSHGENGKKKSASGCIDGFGNDLLGSRSVDNILKLYYEGIAEAWRVLKPKGILIVKCQDQVESGKQRFLHVDIHEYCTAVAGFGRTTDVQWVAEDLFVVIATKTPMMRHSHQFHARKNHSYFQVFRKRR